MELFSRKITEFLHLECTSDTPGRDQLANQARLVRIYPNQASCSWPILLYFNVVKNKSLIQFNMSLLFSKISLDVHPSRWFFLRSHSLPCRRHQQQCTFRSAVSKTVTLRQIGSFVHSHFICIRCIPVYLFYWWFIELPYGFKVTFCRIF